MIALFAFAGGVLAAGYVEWGGTGSYNKSMDRLEAIEGGITNLLGEKGTVEGELTKEKADIKTLEADKSTLEGQLDTLTTAKDKAEARVVVLEGYKAKVITEGTRIVNGVNKVNGKGPKFDYLRTEINNLGLGEILNVSEGNGPKSDQLKQAEEDMGQVDVKTKEVLKTLGIEDPTVEVPAN